MPPRRRRGRRDRERLSFESVQPLLEQIYVAPDDDGPRLVYADWLIERGDPLGTFMSLQLSRDSRHEPVSTEEQGLLDEHWSAWVGTPSEVLFGRHVEFDRGMWSACECAGVDELSRLDTQAHSWATVRRLSIDEQAANQIMTRLLDGPLHRSLRVL